MKGSGGTLKRKLAELRSLYGISKCNFEASGQGDPDAFPLFAMGRAHIMYTFFFLKQYPVIEPLTTRDFETRALREEGFGARIGGPMTATLVAALLEGDTPLRSEKQLTLAQNSVSLP